MSNELGQKLNGQLLPEGGDLENNGVSFDQELKQTKAFI